MRYSVAFACFAALLAVVATAMAPGGLLLIWPAASCTQLAAAYALGRPGLLGKRVDGTQRAVAVAVLAPFLAIQYAVWFALHRVVREAPSHEVAPGLWVGRRPSADEVPPQVQTIVDLTAEFPESADVRARRRYICVPTLDATPPRAAELASLAHRLAESPHPVLIHCASGHGRSALVAACVLLVRQLASGPEDAAATVTGARPGARIGGAQAAALAEFWATWRSSRG